MESKNWVIIGSVNGLSLGWCQAITWTSTELFSIGLLILTRKKNWKWSLYLLTGSHFSSASLCFEINSLWPNDTIWCYKFGSTLAQEIAWCHQASSHYLDSMLTSYWGSVAFTSKQITISQWLPKLLLCIISLKIMRWLSHRRVISVKLGQYHGCWCPGSLRRQGISNHAIDCVE